MMSFDKRRSECRCPTGQEDPGYVHWQIEHLTVSLNTPPGGREGKPILRISTYLCEDDRQANSTITPHSTTFGIWAP